MYKSKHSRGPHSQQLNPFTLLSTYNWSVVEKLDAFRFSCCQFFTRVACWIDKALSRIHPHPMQSNADCQSASDPQSGSYSHSDSYSQNDLDAETMSRLAGKCCKRTCLWQQPEVGKLR